MMGVGHPMGRRWNGACLTEGNRIQHWLFSVFVWCLETTLRCKFLQFSLRNFEGAFGCKDYKTMPHAEGELFYNSDDKGAQQNSEKTSLEIRR